MFNINNRGSNNRIIVNGKVISVSGNNISVQGDTVYVDGQVVEEGLSGNVHIQFEGELASLRTDGSATVNGEVKRDVYAGGSVQAGNVGRDVDAGGSVQCLNVGGDVDAGGSVNMRR